MNGLPPSFTLRRVTVLDDSGSFVGPTDVAVAQGRIDALASSLPLGLGGPDIDAEGLFLLPGVFDCHLHTGLSSFDALELLNTPFSRRILETAQVLRRTLEAGVTFVRDAGIADAGVRDSVEAGFVPGPTMQVAVVALGPTGGHGDGFLAGPGLECSIDYSLPDYPGRPPDRVDGVEEMRKAVRTVVRAGADWIKLIATRGVLAQVAGDFDAELTFDEMAVAVAEASRRRRPVMVHALGGDAIRLAVEAGARSIEHGVFLTEADAALMANQGCTLVPTLAVYERLAALARSGALGAERSERARAVGDVLGRAVAIARAAGVRIALGSDFGHRDHHGSNLSELALLREAGLTAEEALLAATRNGAELCGQAAVRGRIAPGYIFDAIVLDGDPGDLSAFREPSTVTGVFRAGSVVRAHPRLGGAR